MTQNLTPILFLFLPWMQLKLPNQTSNAVDHTLKNYVTTAT